VVKIGDWKPLYISLGITFVLGFLLPLILAPFAVEDEFTDEATGLFATLSNFIDNGISLFGFSFNPTQIIFGEAGKDFLVQQYLAFSLIPGILQVMILIIIITGWVYTIVKLLPTT